MRGMGFVVIVAWAAGCPGAGQEQAQEQEQGREREQGQAQEQEQGSGTGTGTGSGTGAGTGTEQEREAWTVVARMGAHAHEVPEGAPTVAVHAPAGLDASAPLDIVMFLHGWSGCSAVLMESGSTRCAPGMAEQRGWGLGARHDEAGTRTLFVVPQLTWLERNGRPGRFTEDGFARAFLEELLGVTLRERLGVRRLADVRSITLLPHSAGYETALAILAHGQLGELVRNVVLFDSLYAGAPIFLDWLAAAPDERRLVSLYTARGRTFRQSQSLLGAARDRLGRDRVAAEPRDLAAAVRTHPIVVAESPAGHGAVPDHHLPTLLPALFPPAR